MKRMNQGFSLIEVIASSVMVVTTAGALFAVASMSLRLTVQGQDRTIAAQLAREGIEVVRQIRDRNVLSSACTTGGCPAWYSNIFDTAGSAIQAKQIVPIAQLGGNAYTPFRLNTIALSGNQRCSDYIVRNVDTGAFNLPSGIPTEQPGQQIFCRRVYVEFVDLPETPENDAQTQDALRIRSQVTWLGFGKTSFRDVSQGGIPLECEAGGTEWCTEQVTLLTNWRPSL